MPSLLQIDVSPRGDHSISRQISGKAVTAWKKKNPAGKVIWAGQVVLAAAFLLAGGAKLTGEPAMVALFEAIGAG